MIELIFRLYGEFLFIYFVLVNSAYFVLIMVSWLTLSRFIKNIKSEIIPLGDYTKPISILIPAYNEEDTVVNNIDSLLELNYPNFEIIVINDGSKDDTLNRIINTYNLRKIDFEINSHLNCNEIYGVYSSFENDKIKVVDKKNGGKADALNAGINVSKFPLFAAIDADCIIEKNALIKIVRPFIKYDDTIAVGGMVRISNGGTIEKGKLIEALIPDKAIEKYQIIEYFRAFLSSRIGWYKLNSLLIISGAFGVFKKSSVIKVGGYKKTIGEDMELTVRLHEYHTKEKIPYKVFFESDAVCWTEAPSDIKSLRNQRIRWHRGLIDTLVKHKKMILNPRYGYAGLVSLPYYLFVECLGPVFEIIGYIVILLSIYTGDFNVAIVYTFLMAYSFGILFSFSAIFLEEISYARYRKTSDVINMFIYALLEQFGYRQMTVFWRVSSFFNYGKGSKKWGQIKRKKLIN